MILKIICLSLLVSIQIMASQPATIKHVNGKKLAINQVFFQSENESDSLFKLFKKNENELGNKIKKINKTVEGFPSIVIEHKANNLDLYNYFKTSIDTKYAASATIGASLKNGKTFFSSSATSISPSTEWYYLDLGPLHKFILESGYSLENIDTYQLLISPTNLQTFSKNKKKVLKNMFVNSIQLVQDMERASSSQLIASQAIANTPVSKLGIQSLSIQTTASPNISSIAVQNSELLSNDYLPSEANITLDASDSTSGVGTWNVFIKQNNTTVQSFSGNGSGSSSISETISYTALSDGTFDLIVQVSNTNGILAESTIENLTVQSTLALENIVCGPNPYNPNDGNLSIQYQLTKAADITGYIYSITGEKQWQFNVAANDPSGGKAGFNSVEFNGLNSWGETLKTGPYILYLVANLSGKTVVKKQKVMVVQ